LSPLNTGTSSARLTLAFHYLVRMSTQSIYGSRWGNVMHFWKEWMAILKPRWVTWLVPPYITYLATYI